MFGGFVNVRMSIRATGGGGGPHVIQPGMADAQRDASAALIRHSRGVEPAVPQQQPQQARRGGPLEVEVKGGKVRGEPEVVCARVERKRRLGRVPVDVLEGLHTRADSDAAAVSRRTVCAPDTCPWCGRETSRRVLEAVPQTLPRPSVSDPACTWPSHTGAPSTLTPFHTAEGEGVPPVSSRKWCALKHRQKTPTHRGVAQTCCGGRVIRMVCSQHMHVALACAEPLQKAILCTDAGWPLATAASMQT